MVEGFYFLVYIWRLVIVRRRVSFEREVIGIIKGLFGMCLLLNLMEIL